MRESRIQGRFINCPFAPDKDTSLLGLKKPKMMSWMSKTTNSSTLTEDEQNSRIWCSDPPGAHDLTACKFKNLPKAPRALPAHIILSVRREHLSQTCCFFTSNYLYHTGSLKKQNHPSTHSLCQTPKLPGPSWHIFCTSEYIMYSLKVGHYIHSIGLTMCCSYFNYITSVLLLLGFN